MLREVALSIKKLTSSDLKIINCILKLILVPMYNHQSHYSRKKERETETERQKGGK